MRPSGSNPWRKRVSKKHPIRPQKGIVFLRYARRGNGDGRPPGGGPGNRPGGTPPGNAENKAKNAAAPMAPPAENGAEMKNLWYVNEKGEPESIPVMTGVTDGIHTEILGPDNLEGRQIIEKVKVE